MYLFSKETYSNRRAELCKMVGDGLLIFMGNDESPMNCTDNVYHFVQDSTFRYFFGIDLPGLRATIDCSTGEATIYGNEFTLDDIIWVGEHPSIQSLAEQVGVKKVLPSSRFSNVLQNEKNLHWLPPYRHNHIIELSSILSTHPNHISTNFSEEFIKGIVKLRSYKSHEEIVQMEEAVNITRSMHLAAMKSVKEGKYEYEVVAEIMHTLNLHNAHLAYPVIFSVHGETLHNHYHGNLMNSGKLALNDSGACNIAGYAGDITRTIPVDKRFTTQQKEIYQLVLDMEKSSIDMLKPGILYRDIHIASNRLMLEGLSDIGLVSGNIDDMLEQGVGGMFMPHGLGHMIGMDVHDMENLGEDYVGYAPGLERSTQLGLKSLRLARALENGFILTVEPGIYFIPALIDKMKANKQFIDFVHYDKLEAYKDFGGIRIEDNVLVTEDSYRILGEYIPKEIDEIESIHS